MRGSRRFRRIFVALLLGSLAAAAPFGQTREPHALLPSEYLAEAPPELCGTGFLHLQSLGLATATPLADGEPLFAEQSPPILSADYTGTITIKTQVVGDVSTIEFERGATDAASSKTETWERTGTRTVGGRVVSIFEKSYPDSELAGTLRRYNWGFDDGGLYWGRVKVPGSDHTRSLRLRIGSTNLPTAGILPSLQPVQLADDVQWAGSVVNIRIPDFGDSRVQDGQHGFELQAAAKKFYEHFPDSYDSIAFIPQSQAFASYGAFHRIVKNEVSGIGNVQIFDNSSQYGSGGTLKAVEVYPQTAFTTNDTTSHELTHQWANYIDWQGITGVEGKGHEPSGHTPLVSGGETLVGAVLDAERRVKQVSGFSTLTGSDFEIEGTPFPIGHHPIDLYLMGKRSADQVGTFLIFENQGQFNPTTSSAPDPGTKLQGEVKEVTMGAIIGKHGSWSGPNPSEWRRATVVVSRDALLSQREMDYWNFYAQRLADPDRTGVPSYKGYVSFDATTGNTLDVKADITANAFRALGRVGRAVEVTNPQFGKRDWRGVEFDSTVPNRFTPGQAVRLTGKVIATDRTDFNQILVRFWKANGTADNSVRFSATVSRSGTFTLDIQLTDAQKGIYLIEVFLFWPDAGSQYPRGRLTPVIVG